MSDGDLIRRGFSTMEIGIELGMSVSWAHNAIKHAIEDDIDFAPYWGDTRKDVRRF